MADGHRVPDIIKNCCQNTLTAQWTKRLPILQQQAPAELAAEAILDALSRLKDVNTADWTVIDFCSGAGGTSGLLDQMFSTPWLLTGTHRPSTAH